MTFKYSISATKVLQPKKLSATKTNSRDSAFTAVGASGMFMVPNNPQFKTEECSNFMDSESSNSSRDEFGCSDCANFNVQNAHIALHRC